MRRFSPISRAAILGLLVAVMALSGADDPNGFANAAWGSSPEAVRAAAGLTAWQPTGGDSEFPAGLNVTVFQAQTTLAGYPATVRYYFYNGQFFQATARFPFPDLENFDFNYNVFISVDRYYRAIHDRTLTFVGDIYTLLASKYGKKKPVFKGLDPRQVFRYTDTYLAQEQWNLRYHPYEFYRRIVCAAYARWDFPRTRAIFAVNISAIDKRFDYTLSLSSVELEGVITRQRDNLRMQGL